MIVFNGFEVLEWVILAFMVLILVVGVILFKMWVILERLKEKFRVWKDKRRKRKL